MGYLVVSRKIGERILIGDDIEILISDINRTHVDVAIKAPKNIQIKRKATHLEVENGTGIRDKSRQRYKAN